MIIGGIEIALINFLNNIDYNKYDVTLVLEEKKGILLDKINSNVNVFEYKVSKNKLVFFRKLYNFIKRTMFRMKYYHMYDFSCCYATYSLVCSRLALIASTNNSIYIHSDYSNLYRSKQEFCNFFNKLKINLFKNIIFVSNEARTNFLGMYHLLADKCVTINNFVDSDNILKSSKEKIDIKKTHDNLFVFVGRLDESSKNLTMLIDIIDFLVKQNISIELWIIGDGPDCEMYKKNVNEKKLNDTILFFGRKNNPYPYIKYADYVILTSKYEGFPVVYMESIILGTPIITTIDVSDEYFSIKNRFGFIISSDLDKAKKQVAKIITDKKTTLEKVDMNYINKMKMQKLEKIFDNDTG